MAKSKIYCSLDLEGTGLDPSKDAMIEVGAILFHFGSNGEVVYGKEFSQLIKPSIPVPQFIQNLTGIAESDLKDKPAWEEVRETFKNFVGEHIIVGQNVQFDLNFLASAGLSFSQEFIDTKELAQVFAPHLRYFNLEFLLKTLGKPLTSHHRALDDSRSAVELLALVIREYHYLPISIQQKIATLLKDSSLVWRDLFMPSKKFPERKDSTQVKTDVTQGTLFEHTGSSDRPAQTPPAWWDFIRGTSGTYFVETGYQGFTSTAAQSIVAQASDSTKQTVICLGGTDQASDLAKKIPKFSGIILRSPDEYICGVRLNALEREPSKSDALIQFLAKVLVWRCQEAMGNTQGSLPVSGEEIVLRDSICGRFDSCGSHGESEQELCELSQHLKAVSSGRSIVTNHATWLRYASVSPAQKIPRGIFWGAKKLEEALQFFDTRNITLRHVRSLILALYDPQSRQGLLSGIPAIKETNERVLDSLDLFFGALTVKLAQRWPNLPQILIEQPVREEEIFLDMRSAAEHFLFSFDTLLKTIDAQDITRHFEIDRIVSALHRASDDLKEFFLQPSSLRAYWFEGFSGRLKLRSRLRRPLISLLGKFDSLAIVDVSFPKSVIAYWQREYAFDGIRRAPSQTMSMENRLWLASSLPEKESPRARQETNELFIRTAGKFTGRSIVLLNSHRLLEQFYEHLLTTDLKPRLIAQKFTGHHWKNLERYQSEEHAIWLMTTQHLLTNAFQLPLVRSIVFMSIPYDTPGIFDALYAKEKIFTEIIIPRTIMRLTAAVAQVIVSSANPSSLDVFVFDPRLMSGYNSALLQALVESLHATPQSISISDPARLSQV
ncbi:MAG TPA: exonuclease domain-containing protein [Patescibacteria group bacterium]|nr:exonuclease domain-containing protein [Patescibacteria group bacterium]